MPPIRREFASLPPNDSTRPLCCWNTSEQVRAVGVAGVVTADQLLPSNSHVSARNEFES